MRKQIVTALAPVVAAMVIVAAVLTTGGCTKSGSSSAPNANATTSLTPGSTSSAAPATAFMVYDSARYRFTIRYPKGWPGGTSTATGGAASGGPALSVAWADPAGKQVNGHYLDALQVAVFKLTKPIKGSSDLTSHAADFKAIAYGLIKSDPKLRITDPFKPVTVNGTNGLQVTYTYTVQGEPTGAMSYLLLPSGRYAYWVTGQASAATWSSAWTKLTPAMASFTHRPLVGGAPD